MNDIIKYLDNDEYAEKGDGGKLLKDFRKNLGVSLKSFAELAGISRSTYQSIEDGQIIGRTSNENLAKIKSALKQIIIEKKRLEVSDVNSDSHNGLIQDNAFNTTWSLYCYSRTNSSYILNCGFLEFDRDGLVVYRIENSNSAYTGHFAIESDGRLVVILDSVSTAKTEKVVFRFQNASYADEHEIVGHWLGIDRRYDNACGGVLLSKNPIKDKDAIQQKLDAIESPWIKRMDISPSENQVTVLDLWDPTLLAKRIVNCRPHVFEISLASTLFNEFPKIKNAIKKLHQSGRYSKDKKLKIRVLLLRPDMQQTLHARFKLIDAIPDPSKRILSQAKKLIEYAERYEDQFIIDTRFYTTFPFGHYFCIGDSSFVGLYLPHQLASDGPMIKIDSRDSPLWIQYNNCFDGVFKHSIPVKEFLESDQWKEFQRTEKPAKN